MSPVAHALLCAACLGLALTDLAWLDAHAVEMGAQRLDRRAPAGPSLSPPPPRPPAPVTLTAVTVAAAAPGPATAPETSESAIVTFASGAEDPADGDLPALAEMAAALARDPDFIAMIEGHADRSGSAAYNLFLSERRAAGVARRLEASGVTPGRVRVRGFGATRPADDGLSQEALRRNRRVEIHLRRRGEQ